MAGEGWWQQYTNDDDDGPAVPPIGERGADSLPSHWGREPQASPTTHSTSETVSDLLSPPTSPAAAVPLGEILLPDTASSPANARPGRIVVAFIAAVLLGVAALLAFASEDDVRANQINPTTVALPAGFEADATLDRAALGLSSRFSEPLVFRSSDALLVLYSRSIRADDVDRSVTDTTAQGSFARELADGAPGLTVETDEQVNVGAGGRHVVLSSDAGATLRAVTYVVTDDTENAVVVAIVSGPGSATVDVVGLAAGIGLEPA